MKRVMIVTNSLTGGGAERSMNLVSSELASRGWPISLVPINASEPDLVVPTCEVYPINRQWNGGFANTISAFHRFNKILRSWKPDIIVLNCDLPEFFGAMLPGKYSFVVVEHSNPAWTTRMNFGRIIRGILKMRGTIWVAVSSHLHIWPYQIAPVAILQNPLIHLAEGVTEISTVSKLGRLVFVGRLASAQKRPDWIIKVGALTGLDVLVIGDGNMMPGLKAEANASHSKTEFAGYVRDPWSRLKPGDLLLVPSAWEGDGLVVIEGLSRRIPMLLTDISDFQRFMLPQRNYCHDIDDFAMRTIEYRDKLSQLVVPEPIRNSILASRSVNAVGDAWEHFLTSFIG